MYMFLILSNEWDGKEHPLNLPFEPYFKVGGILNIFSSLLVGANTIEEIWNGIDIEYSLELINVYGVEEKLPLYRTNGYIVLLYPLYLIK